ncbi:MULTISPECIES: SUMF1/EgtB/PvdO family nonheme iron enzyme [Nostocales]|uniref:SUMF1/EgtB/PvdO family nonheme iron enzyme n=1 Tax=Nostocales TaxID=1161 RepID=UPI0004B2E9F7|nr:MULTISPECIES: SUMF1/EgtB/PvdO family nonheme iron enzyme [Nostocales]
MGRNWAIVVGINHYENLRSLNFAKRDASVMATWFEQDARFDQVFLFTDDSAPIAANPPIPTQPTFGHLRRFLRAQFENIQTPLLKPEDNLWFFFAGHGNRYKDQDYLMFSDSDPGDIEHTAISVDFVTQRLRRSGADNVVLFLDACRDESSRAGLGIGEQRHQGVITFYSCTANKQSWEIEELEHGSFTYSLLEGLRLQGEANCATVERLEQYLRYQVPALNARYGKEAQNPYLQAEPPYKMYFILLEQTATLRDVEPLKYQASQAENRGNLSLAKQLWVRVLAVSRIDSDAIDAIGRIALRQQGSFKFTIAPDESVTSSSGGRSASAELLTQKQEEHRQNLVPYQQAFSEAIEREYPISRASRNKLKQLQQSLQLKEEEVLQIEQPIIAQKEAEYRKQQEAEKQRQQEEAARLKQQEAETKQQREEAEYRQKLQQYEQELIKTINAGNSLKSHVIRLRLNILQLSLGLKQTDITAIEGRVVASQELIKSPIQQPSVAQPTQLTQERISRQKFLKWAGLGSVGLVTAVVGREIFKVQSPTPISVAKPKYTLSTTEKAFGLPLWNVEFETVTVDEKGQVIKRDSNKQAKFFKEDLGNGVTLEMVSIPGGSFKMGSPSREKSRNPNESPQHDVNVPAFFMGRFEVTQEQYQQVMGTNPSNFKGKKLLVESVSWNDAVEFCNKLSQKTGRKYRLPSEAEWEYACRAGTNTPFHFGETITTELVNYDGNRTYASEPKGKYRQETPEVGSFPPNGSGLYDMHGNVWEWCQDTWHDSYKGAPSNGSAWINNDNQSHVLRGGSWFYDPKDCRSASRTYYTWAGRVDIYINIGFRVVCAVGRILK